MLRNTFSFACYTSDLGHEMSPRFICSGTQLILAVPMIDVVYSTVRISQHFHLIICKFSHTITLLHCKTRLGNLDNLPNRPDNSVLLSNSCVMQPTCKLIDPELFQRLLPTRARFNTSEILSACTVDHQTLTEYACQNEVSYTTQPHLSFVHPQTATME